MLSTLLQIFGVALVAVGAGLEFFPAGVVLAGVGVLLFGLALDKGDK